uniref:Tail protein n=1 Tax=viral metagenome TaxID=1070528 RepID=A0A6H1Z7E0_9ZZZZ
MLYPYGIGNLGVDYSIPPQALPPGALANASNMVITDSGLLTGRNGYLKLNNGAVDPGGSRMTSLFEYRSGTTVKTLCSYGTDLAYYDATTNAFIDYVTTLTSDKMCQWVNFGGKAISVNEGSDHPQYFDGTTGGDLAGTPPHGKTICDWSSRVWLGGDSTDVALLTGCYISDPTDWTTTTASIGIVEQFVGDPKDPITGIFGFFDWLLVGKKNILYKLSGDPPTNSSNLSIYPVYDRKGDSAGFTSPWAITQVGNDVIFLDGFDIKRLSGIQEFGDVESASVIPHFREYLRDIADKDYIQYTKFYHYKNKQQIWVSIPTSATTHYVFVIEYRFYRETGRYAVFPMSGLNITDLTGIANGSVDDLYGAFQDGIARHLDVDDCNDDAGVAIPRHFTQVIAGMGKGEGATEHRKQFHKLNTYVKPSISTLTMTPSYAVDLMDAEQIRDETFTDLSAETASGWPGTGVKRKDIRLFGISGKSMALKWSHEKIGENFIMQPSSVEYEIKQKIEIV